MISSKFKMFLNDSLFCLNSLLTQFACKHNLKGGKNHNKKEEIK